MYDKGTGALPAGAGLQYMSSYDASYGTGGYTPQGQHTIYAPSPSSTPGIAGVGAGHPQRPPYPEVYNAPGAQNPYGGVNYSPTQPQQTMDGQTGQGSWVPSNSAYGT